MEIPLPPNASKSSQDMDEYSPSQITSPQSDDDDSKLSNVSFNLQNKKMLSKKKASNILKSFKILKKSKFDEDQESNSQEEEFQNSIAKAEKSREKLKERDRERNQKLNIESLIEEEQQEKRLIPKLDLMPNKAGSSFKKQ